MRFTARDLKTTMASSHFRLERIDPGAHRRIKGLRLTTAYGIAAMFGALLQHSYHFSASVPLGFLAAGFTLWASVSEGQATRWRSTRDLLILNAAAVAGGISLVALGPILIGPYRPGAECVLVLGAFLVGDLKRFGILGAGIGSQIFIGQLLTFGYGLQRADILMIALAGVIGAVAAIIPRVLSGPAEHPVEFVPVPDATNGSRIAPATRMGLQAAIAASVIVLANTLIGLRESAWAITACTYVIAGSAAGTMQRVRRRIVGTLVGVPLGIACLPIALHVPPLAWMLAALAMVIYAMALPERYDIACAAYAFTLMVTLAVTGESSIPLLAARAWETLIGGAVGVTVAKLILPLSNSAASPYRRASV